MSTLVECVPNFSEGRNLEKVRQIVAALCSLPGVSLLDQEMDADHNRCVITIVGPKEVIGEAALRGVGTAAKLINLTQHQGAHPRIGAADVVPFIPIRGVTLEDCVQLARSVGAEIWKRFQIPVYLYEAAATRPDRTNLENIRRGQFEGLREEIATNPDRAPDFGEPRVHPTAGATVVGTRKFLIAYNINLNTPDVRVAKAIAKAIRFSSGGLRYVKAMGVELKARNLAQVSINLTDFEQTPIFRVFELVNREAARYGASVVGSEIVGLVPKRALEMASDFFLQLENFDPEKQILENRLASVLAETSPVALAVQVEAFLSSVAAPKPTPGGGSVAALVAALAAALGQMVADLSKRKKAHAEHSERLEKHARELEMLCQELKTAMDADAESFEVVLAAQRLPQASEAQKQARARAIEQALQHAAAVPLGVAEATAAVLEHLNQLVGITSAAMASDLKTGKHLAQAALRGALENVEINLSSLEDKEFVSRQRQRLAALESRLAEADLVAR
ncbi:MAG: glutamate formimidoyltransferase [Terriglobia bacterium]